MIEKMNFGRTGHASARTLFGAAALGSVTQAVADQTLEVLLKYGVNHIDTAFSYGDAELRIGPWMKEHRKTFFLATKTGERTYEAARKQIRQSLERLQTDHLDLIQLHAVTKDEELDQLLSDDGGLRAAVEARDEGLVRFIGITSHTLHAPKIHMRALENFDFTSVLLPLNYPMYSIPQYREDFDALVAVCKEKNVALQTIKSICRRPWEEGMERWASCWYEPLTEPEALDKAVGWVLGHPAKPFLNTVGDVKVLPSVFEAAARWSGSQPSNEEMDEMVDQYAMIPLWPEHAGMH